MCNLDDLEHMCSSCVITTVPGGAHITYRTTTLRLVSLVNIHCGGKIHIFFPLHSGLFALLVDLFLGFLSLETTILSTVI